VVVVGGLVSVLGCRVASFLISKVYFKKAQRGATQSTHNVYRKPKSIEKEEHKSKKLEKVQSDIVVNITLHVNKVCSANFFKLSKLVSQFSKLGAFCSFHRHHIKYK
jgi:H+/gluconate symporter-like permease